MIADLSKEESLKLQEREWVTKNYMVVVFSCHINLLTLSIILKKTTNLQTPSRLILFSILEFSNID